MERKGLKFYLVLKETEFFRLCAQQRREKNHIERDRENWVLKEALSFKLQEQYVRGGGGASPESLTLTNCLRGPELAGKKTLAIGKSTLRVCAYWGAINARRTRNEKKIVHLLVLQGWKSRQRWCPPVPGQAKLLLDCVIPHAACPSSSSCITTTSSYFSLKSESQRKFLLKPTFSCSAP